MSSTASKTSEVSHATTTSCLSDTSGLTTSSALSTDTSTTSLDKAPGSGLEPRRQEGGKAILNSETVAALSRLGSFATIQTSAALGPQHQALEFLENQGMQIIQYDEADFEDDEAMDGPSTPLSPIHPPQPTSTKSMKRSSAPPKLTSSPGPFSPTKSVVSDDQTSSVARSTMSNGSSKRKSRNATAGSASAIISRQSSHTRSSSRGAAGDQPHALASPGTLAALSNLGGGAVVAAAYPPPTATTGRKQMTVGGKGRSRAAPSKGHRAKGVVRRNSAGPGLDLGGVVAPLTEALEKMVEGVTTGAPGLERKPSQKVVQMGFDDNTTRVPTPHDRRSSEPVLQSQPSTLAQDQPMGVPKGDSVIVDVLPVTASPESISAMVAPAVPSILPGCDAQEPIARHPVKFNIGSNSDEGKSTSSVSGAHSVAPGYVMAAGEQVKGNGRMMVDEERFKAKLAEEEKKQQLEENELRRRQQELMRQQQEAQQQEIRRQNTAQLMALGQPRFGGQSTLQHPDLVNLENKGRQQVNKAVSKPPSRQVSAALLAPPPVTSAKSSDKSKGKNKVLSPPIARATSSSKHSRNKSKSIPQVANLDPELAAKVRDSLAEPLLPQGRRVVVATESEFETDSEDGSWSSAVQSEENDVSLLNRICCLRNLISMPQGSSTGAVQASARSSAGESPSACFRIGAGASSPTPSTKATGASRCPGCHSTHEISPTSRHESRKDKQGSEDSRIGSVAPCQARASSNRVSTIARDYQEDSE